MTPTQKYLIYISYLGTEFRGSQIQKCKHAKCGLNTVQGTVENVLNYYFGFLDQEYLGVTLTSRTDSGVHALKAGLHVNLPPFKGKFVDPEYIKNKLNSRFIYMKTNIRAVEIIPVPDVFCAARSVLEKVYTYRVGFFKENSLINNVIPILESDRTFFVRNNGFDAEKVQKALSMFVGEKDFGSFVNKFSKNTKSPICNIKSFKIEEAQPLLSNFDCINENFNYYHFVCIGNRFLYKMVRRMVGTLLCLGLNKASLDDIQLMFDQPNGSSWPARAFVPPGYGLYLSNVIYKPEHLIISAEEKQKKLELLEALHISKPVTLKNTSKSKTQFLGFKKFYEKINKMQSF